MGTLLLQIILVIAIYLAGRKFLIQLLIVYLYIQRQVGLNPPLSRVRPVASYGRMKMRLMLEALEYFSTRMIPPSATDRCTAGTCVELGTAMSKILK